MTPLSKSLAEYLLPGRRAIAAAPTAAEGEHRVGELAAGRGGGRRDGDRVRRRPGAMAPEVER